MMFVSFRRPGSEKRRDHGRERSRKAGTDHGGGNAGEPSRSPPGRAAIWLAAELSECADGNEGIGNGRLAGKVWRDGPTPLAGRNGYVTSYGQENSQRPMWAMAPSRGRTRSTTASMAPSGGNAVEKAAASVIQPICRTTRKRGTKSRSPEAMTRMAGVGVVATISVPYATSSVSMAFSRQLARRSLTMTSTRVAWPAPIGCRRPAARHRRRWPCEHDGRRQVRSDLLDVHEPMRLFLRQVLSGASGGKCGRPAGAEIRRPRSARLLLCGGGPDPEGCDRRPGSTS